jgi:hypothetical protein
MASDMFFGGERTALEGKQENLRIVAVGARQTGTRIKTGGLFTPLLRTLRLASEN